jgi:hypothetical protein
MIIYLQAIKYLHHSTTTFITTVIMVDTLQQHDSILRTVMISIKVTTTIVAVIAMPVVSTTSTIGTTITSTAMALVSPKTTHSHTLPISPNHSSPSSPPTTTTSNTIVSTTTTTMIVIDEKFAFGVITEGYV